MTLPPEGSIVSLDMVLSQILLVLEESGADSAGYLLTRHVDVGNVLAQVARVGEHLAAQVAPLRLHAPPLAPAPAIYTSTSAFVHHPHAIYVTAIDPNLLKAS